MVTTVIAVRHAKAKTEGYADPDLYPLSEEGKEVQKQAALKLKNAGYTPTKIYCSPLLRAVQTADIISTLFDVPYSQEPALGPEFNGETLLARLPPTDSNQTILFVGHAPTLAEWVNTLTTKGALQSLSKSDAAIITINHTQAQLIEVIHA